MDTGTIKRRPDDVSCASRLRFLRDVGERDVGKAVGSGVPPGSNMRSLRGIQERNGTMKTLSCWLIAGMTLLASLNSVAQPANEGGQGGRQGRQGGQRGGRGGMMMGRGGLMQYDTNGDLQVSEQELVDGGGGGGGGREGVCKRSSTSSSRSFSVSSTLTRTASSTRKKEPKPATSSCHSWASPAWIRMGTGH